MSPRNQAMTRAVQEMLVKIKTGCFSDGYEASDTEAMGLLLSHFFDYEGADILKAAEAALEDANFHDACAEVGEIRAKLEGSRRPSVRLFQAPSTAVPDKIYLVTLGGKDGDACQCGDFMYRRHACKHIRGAYAGVYGRGTLRTV